MATKLQALACEEGVGERRGLFIGMLFSTQSTVNKNTDEDQNNDLIRETSITQHPQVVTATNDHDDMSACASHLLCQVSMSER